MAFASKFGKIGFYGAKLAGSLTPLKKSVSIQKSRGNRNAILKDFKGELH
jgi:hypothetical protein